MSGADHGIGDEEVLNTKGTKSDLHSFSTGGDNSKGIHHPGSAPPLAEE